MKQRVNELFFMDKVELNGTETQQFSFGSVWLTFFRRALVAINRYNTSAHEIEAYVVRNVVKPMPPLAYSDYRDWVDDKFDLRLTDLAEEYNIQTWDWKTISPEEIHAKAAQWLGDQVAHIVQDRLTGGD